MFILYLAVLAIFCLLGLLLLTQLAKPTLFKHPSTGARIISTLVGTAILAAVFNAASGPFKHFGDELYAAKLEARSKFEKEAISKQNPKKPVAAFLFATEKLCFEEKFSSKVNFKNFTELSNACMKESLAPFERMVAASNKNPETVKSLEQAKKLLSDRTSFESDSSFDSLMIAGKKSIYKYYGIS